MPSSDEHLHKTLGARARRNVVCAPAGGLTFAALSCMMPAYKSGVEARTLALSAPSKDFSARTVSASLCVMRMQFLVSNDSVT